METALTNREQDVRAIDDKRCVPMRRQTSRWAASSSACAATSAAVSCSAGSSMTGSVSSIGAAAAAAVADDDGMSSNVSSSYTACVGVVAEGRRDDQSQAVAADLLVGDDPERVSSGDAAPSSDVHPVVAAEAACRKRASALGCDT